MRKALFILADLDESDLEWMVEAGRQLTIAEGEAVIKAGAPVAALYIVLEGHCRVQLDDGTLVARIAVGDILGEMSLIEKRPPNVSVVADGFCRLLAIPQADVAARLEANPAFAGRFYRALAVFLSDRLRSTVASLGYGDAKEPNFEATHELDEGVLDNVHVAGDRMRRILEMLEAAPT